MRLQKNSLSEIIKLVAITEMIDHITPAFIRLALNFQFLELY